MGGRNLAGVFGYDLLLAASVLFYAGVIAFYLRHPAAAFWHPVTIYLGFHGVVFVLRPILARIFDYELLYRYAQFDPSVADKINTILAANLALAVFAFVALWTSREPLEPHFDRQREALRTALQVPVVLVGVLLAPLAFYALIDQWTARATDDFATTLDVASGISYYSRGSGWVASANLMGAPLCALFAWAFRFRWWTLVPFAAFAVLQGGTGGRGALVVAALAIVILYLVERRRRWPDWRSVAIIGVIFVAFTTIVADRGKAIREVFIEDRAYISGGQYETKPLEHMDFGNLEYTEFMVHTVPQRTGTYDYFAHTLQIFTEPIPRALWADKPLGSPVKLFDLPDYGRPYGFTYAIPGIGWMSLGFPGVAIQAALFGLLYGWVHLMLVRRRASPFALLAYALMVAPTIVTFRDGTLLTIVRVLPFYMGPVLLLYGIARAGGIVDPLRWHVGARRSADHKPILQTPAPATSRAARARGAGRATPAARRRALAAAER